jgi:hypothetical protein
MSRTKKEKKKEKRKLKKGNSPSCWKEKGKGGVRVRW